MFLLLGVSFLTGILISIHLTLFFLLYHQRSREEKKRWKHTIHESVWWTSVNKLTSGVHGQKSSRYDSFIYIYLTCMQFALGKQLMLKRYRILDAVAIIGSSIFCFQFMYWLTQPMLVCDPGFLPLSQRTWAVISISQRRHSGWYSVIPCQSCHLSTQLMDTEKLRERGIIMETGRWSSSTECGGGGRAAVGAGHNNFTFMDVQGSAACVGFDGSHKHPNP